MHIDIKETHPQQDKNKNKIEAPLSSMQWSMVRGRQLYWPLDLRRVTFLAGD